MKCRSTISPIYQLHQVLVNFARGTRFDQNCLIHTCISRDILMGNRHRVTGCLSFVSSEISMSLLYFIIWLGPLVGKMNQILHSDWLLAQARWHHLARSRLCTVSHKKNLFFIPYNISFIDQACSVKMAGYWPCSFFACLWTSTSSRSINMQKKNLANIQPS